MLPKLYDQSNGMRYLGTLTNCVKCQVKAAVNGAYVLDLEVLAIDELADSIISQRLISVKPNPLDPDQYFEITTTTRTLGNTIKVEAKHIRCQCFSYCTNAEGGSSGSPYVFNGTPSEVWDEIVDNNMPSGVTVPFNFSSTINTKHDFSLGLNVADSLGNILGNNEGSFLDIWGGEYFWDNFNIVLCSNLHSHYREIYGRELPNYAYKVAYGQNISDASQTETTDGVYSHIQPYGWIAVSGGQKVSIAADLVEIANNESVRLKTMMLDCTEVLEPYLYGPQTQPGTITLAQAKAIMTAYALNYAKRNSLGKRSVNISVDIRAELDEMSDLMLGDSVKVILDNLGTITYAEITSATYDVLLERWDKLVLGEPKIMITDFILNKEKYIQ